MKIVVGWKNQRTKQMYKKGAVILEAPSKYRAKKAFWIPRIKGTELEGVKVQFLLKLVAAKRVENGRVTTATPIPEDFDLDRFIKTLNSRQIPTIVEPEIPA